MPASPGFISADWPAPSNVRAGTTTRAGGVSRGAFASFNLGDRAGDDPVAVAENRRRLRAALDLPAEPAWLWQVHGDGVVRAETVSGAPEADAATAHTPGAVCAVLTADCLPVLLCDREGTIVAAAHCGWRGLAAGVLSATVAAMPAAPACLLAWLGPAIGPDAFEVGGEVRQAYLARDARYADAFRAVGGGKYLADLYALARAELAALGVRRVFGGGRCTVAEPDSFFSYRRDRVCGRMASLIWLRG